MKTFVSMVRQLALIGAIALGWGVAAVAGSDADQRAARRLYDGAPPVIAHEPFGSPCTQCHGPVGLEVPGVGFAPPSPHGAGNGPSASARCAQCHVWKTTQEVFVESSFVGLAQDLRRGRRLYAGAPPVIPHAVFMRANCGACHTGPAARTAIRTSHPERVNCRQCHVERTAEIRFERSAQPRR